MTIRPSSNRDQIALTTPSKLAQCDHRLVCLHRPESIEAEQYRCLRYSLLRLLSGRRCNVIAVSSAERGNGRTTAAINLAATLEETGVFRVLLLDADLRGADVAERLALGEVADSGLDLALVDWSVSMRDLVQRFPPSYGFSVLPTAPRPELAHRLLATPRFGMLVQEARDQYDFVIVDTPPLVPTSDCRAMAPWIDGFVVVVGADQTPRKALEDSLNAINQEQILGLAFIGNEGSPVTAHDGVRLGN